MLNLELGMRNSDSKTPCLNRTPIKYQKASREGESIGGKPTGYAIYKSSGTHNRNPKYHKYGGIGPLHRNSVTKEVARKMQNISPRLHNKERSKENLGIYIYIYIYINRPKFGRKFL